MLPAFFYRPIQPPPARRPDFNLRQTTTEQVRRLLAAALGSMLDAFDAMYYSQIPLILS